MITHSAIMKQQHKNIPFTLSFFDYYEIALDHHFKFANESVDQWTIKIGDHFDVKQNYFMTKELMKSVDKTKNKS